MIQRNFLQDKRNIHHHQQHPKSSSCVYSNTSHSSKTKKDDSLQGRNPLVGNFLSSSSSDIYQNSNDIMDELDMHLPNMIASPQGGDNHWLYRNDQDIGFDFEESNQVITNFHDLPVQCDLSDDSSMDSFLLSQTRGSEPQQEQFEVIKGEASTCSTSESLSDDDDDHDSSVSHPMRSSLFNTSCIQNHDTQPSMSSWKTSSMSTMSPRSTPPTITPLASILNRKRNDDKLPKRSVSFSPCLVTEIHPMPRRTCQEEWHRCYYTAHELQRMRDENNNNDDDDDERDEWMMSRGQTVPSNGGWGMQGRQVVITAQEDDDDDVLEF